jgi:hypothetical protein
MMNTFVRYFFLFGAWRIFRLECELAISQSRPISVIFIQIIGMKRALVIGLLILMVGFIGHQQRQLG